MGHRQWWWHLLHTMLCHLRMMTLWKRSNSLCLGWMLKHLHKDTADEILTHFCSLIKIASYITWIIFLNWLCNTFTISEGLHIWWWERDAYFGKAVLTFNLLNRLLLPNWWGVIEKTDGCKFSWGKLRKVGPLLQQHLCNSYLFCAKLLWTPSPPPPKKKHYTQQ